jgi:hypothetical protein
MKPRFRELCVLALCSAISAPMVARAQPAPAELSPEFTEILRWLPADVDALVVATDFTLADADASRFDMRVTEDPFPRFLRGTVTGRALGDPDDPNSGWPIRDVWEALTDRRIEFALLGAREVFPASAFGNCGYAGVHVIRFAEPLGPVADELAAGIRRDAAEVATIAGRDVAVFNWKFGKEPYLQDRDWESLMVVLPRGDYQELIVATQRRLLEEVLARRADAEVPRAALPPELPAWQFLDTSAPIWEFLAKPVSDDAPAPEVREVITFEYHAGDDARFVLRAPGESIPDDPQSVDPYAEPSPPLPARLVHGMDRMEVNSELERPEGEPARLTVHFTGERTMAARREFALTFLAGALFQHCIEQ